MNVNRCASENFFKVALLAVVMALFAVSCGGGDGSAGRQRNAAGQIEECGPEGTLVSSNSTIPDTSVPAVPDTSVPAVPDTSVPAVPDTSVPAVPDTSVPAVPDTSVPAVPDTSAPAVPDVTSSTTPDVTSSTTPDVTSSTTPDVTSSTTPDVTSSTTSSTAPPSPGAVLQVDVIEEEVAQGFLIRGIFLSAMFSHLTTQKRLRNQSPQCLI